MPVSFVLKDPVSSVIVFDTSVFVDQLRTGQHEARLQTVTGLVRTSAIVLAELWRGAATTEERKFLGALERNHPVLETTAKNWTRSGQILAQMRAENGFSSQKLRNLHFDVLIALTVRSYGARLITSNRSDFQLICRYVPLELEIWS